MINRLELVLLLNSTERDECIESMSSLLSRSLIDLITEHDTVVGIAATGRGMSELAAVTLPACTD
jgi:hypothetical protein